MKIHEKTSNIHKSDKHLNVPGLHSKNNVMFIIGNWSNIICTVRFKLVDCLSFWSGISISFCFLISASFKAVEKYLQNLNEVFMTFIKCLRQQNFVGFILFSNVCSSRCKHSFLIIWEQQFFIYLYKLLNNVAWRNCKTMFGKIMFLWKSISLQNLLTGAVRKSDL